MKRILTITAMSLTLMASMAQAQDSSQTDNNDASKQPLATVSVDHNSTRSNKVTIAGPDGGLSEKEKCEAEGGVWYVRPGAAKGFCFKKVSPSGENRSLAVPANDFNSSRSNKTGSISPNGPDADSGGGKGQATNQSNKAD